MIKISSAFLAGVLTMAGVVYTAGARSFALPLFVAGVLVVLVPLVALLASVSRIRMVARFLTAFAHAWEKRISPDASVEVSNGMADQVAAALVGQGATKKAAVAAAQEAVRQSKDFDGALRVGLSLVSRKAA
jgi:cell division protein FtsW (lipid II flippase)